MLDGLLAELLRAVIDATAPAAAAAFAALCCRRWLAAAMLHAAAGCLAALLACCSCVAFNLYDRRAYSRPYGIAYDSYGKPVRKAVDRIADPPAPGWISQSHGCTLRQHSAVPVLC
eukprot:COSAG01_NODE_4249_length_5207_cov_3.508319_2_plen_116_part_00